MIDAKRRTAVSDTGVRHWRIVDEGGVARRSEELNGVNGASMRSAHAGTASRAYGESIGSGELHRPGTILTACNRERIPPARQAAMAGMHPLKRLGTPEDVANAAAFLASEAAWITGLILDVTGGAVLT